MNETSSLLCRAFNLPDGIQSRLAQQPTLTKLIVELIIVTRKLNNIITFYDISKVVHFNLTEVVYELGNNREKYVELKKEELVNRYLFSLNLSYKQSCITKYLISCIDDNELVLQCMACLVITLNMLNRKDPLNAVFNAFNTVGWPCRPIAKEKVIKYIMKLRRRPFPEKEIKNTYAREMIRKHIWLNNIY